jgi:hypothetical protein
VKKKTIIKNLGWNELTERIQNAHTDMQESQRFGAESSEDDAESNNEAFYSVDRILYA